MSHRLAGPKRNSLKQGGNSCDTVRHEIRGGKLQKPLILLAIPAGIAPPRNFNSLPQVRHQNESTETRRFWNKCLTFGTPVKGRARAVPSRKRGLAPVSPKSTRRSGFHPVQISGIMVMSALTRRRSDNPHQEMWHVQGELHCVRR
jgi:hypothetical protein